MQRGCLQEFCRLGQLSISMQSNTLLASFCCLRFCYQMFNGFAPRLGMEKWNSKLTLKNLPKSSLLDKKMKTLLGV